MTRTLLLALVALIAICAIECYAEEESETSPAPPNPDQIVRALKTSNLPNERVLAHVKALDGDYKLGNYMAEDYIKATEFSIEKCLSEDIAGTREMCKWTKFYSLRRFCEHTTKQMVQFCRDNREEVRENYFQLHQYNIVFYIGNAKLFKQDYDKHVQSTKLDGNNFEKNVGAVCRKMAAENRETKLNGHRAFVELVDEKLAHLGFTADDMMSFLKPKLERYVEDLDELKELVRMSRAVSKKCLGFFGLF